MQGIIILIVIVGAMVFTQIRVEQHIKENGGKSEWITEKIFNHEKSIIISLFVLSITWSKRSSGYDCFRFTSYKHWNGNGNGYH